MFDCYITFRSVTRAQRAARVLEAAMLSARVVRAPKAASVKGCAYAVLVREADTAQAAELLRKQAITFERAFLRQPDGKLEVLRL